MVDVFRWCILPSAFCILRWRESFLRRPLIPSCPSDIWLIIRHRMSKVTPAAIGALFLAGLHLRNSTLTGECTSARFRSNFVAWDGWSRRIFLYRNEESLEDRIKRTKEWRVTMIYFWKHGWMLLEVKHERGRWNLGALVEGKINSKIILLWKYG